MFYFVQVHFVKHFLQTVHCGDFHYERIVGRVAKLNNNAEDSRQKTFSLAYIAPRDLKYRC